MRTDVRRVALVGAGVIGNAWAAYLLARGLEVAVTDPDPRAAERLRRDVDRALPVLAQLGPVTDGCADRLVFTADLAAAVDGADFVQENAPERDDVKAAIFAELDALVPPDVVVASSSSSMLPSRLAAMCAAAPGAGRRRAPVQPGVPHPAGRGRRAPRTAGGGRSTRRWRSTPSIGKRPVRVRQEVPGHLANRLQAALWREAYSLVERGVASVADLDAAIAHGPGLRWALLGPVANQHLSGGDGGLAHVLEHLGPPTQELMDDLGDVTLTPELAEALVAGVDEELAGIDQTELTAERDALLIGLLTAKSRAKGLP